MYRNSAATDLYLDKRKPSYLGGVLEMCNHRLYRSWADLTDGLRRVSRRTRSNTAGPICLRRPMPIRRD